MKKCSSQFEQISYLVLEANSHCNLSCPSCNRAELESQGLRQPKHLQAAELIQILDTFKNCKVDTVKFQWLSEPMLHPNYDELCRLIRERFPKAFVIIATNLQYDPLKTPFFKTLPLVDMVYLSIDGVGAIYEQARKGATYHKLLLSLKSIQENVSAEVRAQKLFVNFIATDHNSCQLPDIYNLKDRYGLAGVRINLAQNWSVNSSRDGQFSSGTVDVLKNYAQDIKGVGGWEYRDCFWPYNGVTIDVFGDVRMCVIKTDTKPVANIFRDDFQKVYNESLVYLNARSALENNVAPEGCESCSYKSLSPVLEQIFEDRKSSGPRAKVVDL